MPEPEAVQQEKWRDLQPLIDQELNGLPENYRLPILLCDLEGKTIKEATQQLGWPQGTLAGRLARGRKLLAKRLAKREVVLSAGSLAAVVSENVASAGVPTSLMSSTVQAATLIAAGKAAVAGMVSAKVAALMEGVLMSMMLTKLKTVTVVLLVLGIIAFGGGLVSHHKAAAQQQGKPDSRVVPRDQALRAEIIPGTKVQRHSVAFQQTQTEEDGNKPNPPQSLDEAKLHGEWTGKAENVNFSLIFGPGNSIRRITENREPPDDVGTYSVDWGKTPFHLDVTWGKLPTGQTIMEFTKDGKLRIEIGGDIEQARPKTFTDETWVLTKKEKQQAGTKQTEKAALHDLEIADFYRRTGKFGSAQFYYELICYRYPDTDHATTAQQGLEELKKHRIRRADGSEAWESEALEQSPQPQPPPKMIRDAPTPAEGIDELRQQVQTLDLRLKALEVKGKPQPPAKVGGNAPAATREIEELRPQVRNLEWRLAALEGKGKREADAKKEPPSARVGQIIVVGNEKTPTSVILKKVPLYPGQVLRYPDLRIAEKNLAALNATIEVIEGSEGSAFKDILVTVKEK